MAKFIFLIIPFCLFAGQSQSDSAKGLFFLEKYQADSAAHYLLKAVDKEPASDTLITGCAEALLWKKDFNAALSQLRRISNKESFSYKRVVGLYLEMKGEFKQALELYDSLIGLDPRPWNTLFRKAQVLSWLKDFDAAVRLYSNILLTPKVERSMKMAVVIRRAEVMAWQKKTGQALAQLDSLIVSNRHLSGNNIEFQRLLDAWQLKGRFLEWEGRFTEAKDAYKNILLLQPDNKPAKLSLESLLWVK